MPIDMYFHRHICVPSYLSQPRKSLGKCRDKDHERYMCPSCDFDRGSVMTYRNLPHAAVRGVWRCVEIRVFYWVIFGSTPRQTWSDLMMILPFHLGGNHFQVAFRSLLSLILPPRTFLLFPLFPLPRRHSLSDLGFSPTSWSFKTLPQILFPLPTSLPSSGVP